MLDLVHGDQVLPAFVSGFLAKPIDRANGNWAGCGARHFAAQQVIA
jgi:hypothetical protein